MNDKILINSKIDRKAKAFLLIIPAALIFISSVIFIVLAVITPLDSYYYYNPYYDSGYEAAFDGHGGCLAFFIIACTFALLGIISLIMFWAYSKCELSITENNVKGKTLFGKVVVLPLYMVSAYATKKLFSTITIATSSGITKFALVENYLEIGNVLSQKINERQENTATSSNASTPVYQSSAMDELKKLKDLLDAGVITQEEFDLKKKQLLGL